MGHRAIAAGGTRALPECSTRSFVHFAVALARQFATGSHRRRLRIGTL